jgi:hypothetical protein
MTNKLLRWWMRIPKLVGEKYLLYASVKKNQIKIKNFAKAHINLGSFIKEK